VSSIGGARSKKHRNYPQSVRSRLFVVFAAVCFATTGTAQQLGPDNSSPLAVATIRFMIGSLVLFAFASTRPNKHAIINIIISKSSWLLAGFGQALYGATFFVAVRSTGVAVGTVVALGSAPLITSAISALWFRRRPTVQLLFATTIAIVGMALIVTAGKSSAVTTSGVALALCAGLGYALFALGSKTILSSGMSSEAAMARVFGIASLLLMPTLFFVNLDWLTSAAGIAVVLWLGIVTVAVAYWSYATGLRHLEPSETTMITLIEPVAATLLGVVLLSERPSVIGWLGIAVVIIALLTESRLTAKNMK